MQDFKLKPHSEGLFTEKIITSQTKNNGSVVYSLDFNANDGDIKVE